MRLMFVLSRVPYPLEKGDKLRAFHMIRELSKQHEIYLFCLSATKVHPEAHAQLKQYCQEVHIEHLSLYGRLVRLALAFFRPIPFQIAYFHSKSAQAQFERFFEAHLPQHVVCQLVRTAEYVAKYSTIPKTIDIMDALSAGMEKMKRKAKWPLSWLMDIEHRRLVAYERKVVDQFDHWIIISEQDKKLLNLHKDLSVIPNGIGPEFFETRDVSKSRDVLFTGNMSYRPNVESARFLAKEVMPLVWKSHPEVKLTLCGANPSQLVQSLASDKVEVTGWVDDIVELYQSARIFAAPMLINSGLQNKLLEAMASGLPCVTTTLANNALLAKPDQAIVIGDTAAETADAIVKYLNNKELRDRIAGAGKEFVTHQYNWKNEAARMATLMGAAGA